jgi:hypothetical protein
LYIRRVFAVIAECVANFADSMAECFLAAIAGAPGIFEKRLAGDNLAGVSTEAQQNLYSLRRQVL